MSEQDKNLMLDILDYLDAANENIKALSFSDRASEQLLHMIGNIYMLIESRIN